MFCCVAKIVDKPSPRRSPGHRGLISAAFSGSWCSPVSYLLSHEHFLCVELVWRRSLEPLPVLPAAKCLRSDSEGWGIQMGGEEPRIEHKLQEETTQ